MPASSSAPAARRLLVGLFALGIFGCQTPGATRITGPDGSPMAHVRCGGDQGACFRLAGELCPSGYDMRPVLSGHDGNFLIRCRAATALLTPPVCAPAAPTLALPAPAARNSSATGAVGAPQPQGWPPPSEPWPAAYPWTPPETSAGVAPVTPDKPPRPEQWDPGF